jgi:hypothetical protein
MFGYTLATKRFMVSVPKTFIHAMILTHQGTPDTTTTAASLASQ